MYGTNCEVWRRFGRQFASVAFGPCILSQTLFSGAGYAKVLENVLLRMVRMNLAGFVTLCANMMTIPNKFATSLKDCFGKRTSSKLRGAPKLRSLTKSKFFGKDVDRVIREQKLQTDSWNNSFWKRGEVSCTISEALRFHAASFSDYDSSESSTRY